MVHSLQTHFGKEVPLTKNLQVAQELSAPGSEIHAACSIVRGLSPTSLIVPNEMPWDTEIAYGRLKRFYHEVPWEVQERWTVYVDRDPRHPEKDDVVIRKDEFDTKIFVHWRPDSEKRLLEKGIVLEPWQKEWFDALSRRWKTSVYTYYQLCIEMDILLPGFDFYKRARTVESLHCLRVLYYPPGRQVLARAHPDRSAITLHLAESETGLRSRQNGLITLHPTPTAPEALAFSGRQLESVTGGLIRAMWHDVVDTSCDFPERWAMVFFGKMLLDKEMY
jgi:hypothetical protein